MKFLNGNATGFDLTYSDVFLVPNLSDVKSRFDADLTPVDGTGTTIPIVVSNMNAVSGRRMAETVARRGGVAILPQDIPSDALEIMVAKIKAADTVLDTPILLEETDSVHKAMALIHKRSHGAVIVVDKQSRPIGIFTEKDATGRDSFCQLGLVMSRDVMCLEAGLTPKEMYNKLEAKRLSVAPVVKNGKVVGVMTMKGALRSSIYKPAVDKNGKLLVGAAIGINGDAAQRAQALAKMGVDLLVVDTAHGHQKKMLKALEAVRTAVPKAKIIAGNVVTKQAVRDLLNAGADIVKVGIGPGAMCTTRMMTGVGRPQLSAVIECSEEARHMKKHIWADGGVRYPRDVALALAGGASNVMFASWLAGTFESAADMRVDEHGRLYKESYGMASLRAVKDRVAAEAPFDRARKELFEEGISASMMYIDPKRPSVEDIIDQVVAGVRSSFTYAGAKDINDFHQKAVMGVQLASGYAEGAPVPKSWS